MTTDLNKLAKFLVIAKKATYASADSSNIKSERPRHKELEYSDGLFYYRDSYVGFFQAPGMEEVRLGKEGETVWTMAYSGGMLPEFQKDVKMAKDTFNFLKKALALVHEEMPYRGPNIFEEGNWKYMNEVTGDIKRFNGYERILFNNKEVFTQEYIGGLAISK
jgi:hypothetical protein